MKSLDIEISKIQKLMGVTKINESHSSYKNQTLNEGPLVKWAIYGVETGIEAEQALLKSIKKLDDVIDMGKGKKFEFDGIDPKLSRAKQVEEFAKKVKTESLDYESFLLSKTYKDLEELATLASNPLTVKKGSTPIVATDQVLAAEIGVHTSKIFEKDNMWSQAYNETVAEIDGIIANDKTFFKSEQEVADYFNGRLEERISSLRNEAKPYSKYSEYFDWAHAKYTKSGGGLDSTYNKNRIPVSTSPRVRKTSTSDPIEPNTPIRPEDIKYYGAGYYSQVINLFRRIINFVTSRVSQTLDRIRVRAEIIKNFKGEFAEFESLMRAQLKDLQLTDNLYGEWMKLIDELKVVNPDMHAYMKQLMEDTKFSRSWDGNTFKTFIDKYKRLYDSGSLQSSLVKNEVNKIWSEFGSGFTDAWKNFKEGRAIRKSLKGQDSIMAYVTLGFRFVYELGKKIFNFMSWTQILKPSAIANMALRLGQKNLFLGLIYADFVLVLWKKFAKSFVALIISVYQAATSSGSDDGDSTTYFQQLGKELASIWSPIIIRNTSTYFESMGGVSYILPVDFDTWVVKKTDETVVNFFEGSPDAVDQRLQQTYNQMLEEFWNELTDEQKGTAVKVIEKESGTSVAKFRKTYNNRFNSTFSKGDYEKLLSQNMVTDAEVKLVIDSMIVGKQDAAKTVNPNTLDKKFIFDLFNKKLDPDFKIDISAEILNSLKTALFKTKNIEYYTISRKNTDVQNYTFFFTKIPFTPYYFTVKQKDGSYGIYKNIAADKVSIPQEKKDIDKIITDYSELVKIEPKYDHDKAFNASNKISKDTVGDNYKKISEKILDLLNKSLPADTTPSETITMKQFANKL
jgi:hypothetical protein